MDPDLMLVIGLAVGTLSIPSLMGALIDWRLPPVPLLLALVSGGLIWLAVRDSPDGYAISEIPDVIVNVIGRVLN